MEKVEEQRQGGGTAQAQGLGQQKKNVFIKERIKKQTSLQKAPLDLLETIPKTASARCARLPRTRMDPQAGLGAASLRCSYAGLPLHFSRVTLSFCTKSVPQTCFLTPTAPHYTRTSRGKSVHLSEIVFLCDQLRGADGWLLPSSYLAFTKRTTADVNTGYTRAPCASRVDGAAQPGAMGAPSYVQAVTTGIKQRLSEHRAAPADERRTRAPETLDRIEMDS
uniref:Uncharacterized protein n=1 Tax=Knipowitschia caucasica TaxID=637954 RepID=A0AAV2LP66_KNICA